MSEKVVTKFLDFNSCIPYGMQQIYNGCDAQDYRFQFMHPLWDATTIKAAYQSLGGFQFMHPLWDATVNADFDATMDVISIHASLM